jgi:hypothetical protein
MNGPEFLRTNLPSGPISWSTTAQTVRFPPAWADAPGLLSLPVKYGTNNLSAELHTASFVAISFAFAAQLSARISSYPVGPVVITHQPTNLTVMEGRPATFSFFGAGPLLFQWASNGVAIAGATNPTYTIPAVSYAMLSNRYSVVASNKSYWARSSNAVLTVVPDTNRPALLGAYCVSSYQILVSFSEAVTPASAQSLANYAITNSAFPPLAIHTAVLTNGTNVLLTVTPGNGSDYVVVVNNVKDVSISGNQIYPNSNVKIGIKISMPIDSTWFYNEMGTNMPPNWKAAAYDDSLWPSGFALLYYEDAILPAPKRTQLWLRNPDNVYVPTFYFRQHLPLAVGASRVSVSFRHVIDDGAIVYVNGNEIHRFNMAVGPVNHQTLANTNVGNATWSPATDAYKISLTNVLQGGNNVIAAEVHQGSSSSPDVCFGLEMSITAPSGCAGGTLIVDDFGIIQASRLADGRLFLKWFDSSSVLYKSENLFTPPAGWTPVITGVTEYVVAPDTSKRQVFYRLKFPANASSIVCISDTDP